MLRRSTKLMPCLIQDHGIYYGGGVECPLPEFKFSSKTIDNCKSIILEYIELEKEIGKLENKKIELAKKINSDPELQKLLAELTKKNTSVKSR